MTAIYEPNPIDGYEWVRCVELDDYRVFKALDGTPRADSWEPIQVKRFVPEGQRAAKANDFPWLNIDLIMRRRAVDALCDFMEPYGEFLPLLVDDDVELFVFNVTQVVDALDEEHSVLERFEDGAVMWIDSYVFHEPLIRGVDLFKIPTLSKSLTYVSERFVSAVAEAGLVGLEFELLWAST
jgi:hypothetical protein